ncbi:hypothetical protein, partial [Halothiobacillus sp.]|uniref:hypothetical protein n=1 Tax=Halothiobacillus sp. TaxID=1891311 RepID=UPI00260A2F20
MTDGEANALSNVACVLNTRTREDDYELLVCFILPDKAGKLLVDFVWPGKAARLPLGTPSPWESKERRAG